MAVDKRISGLGLISVVICYVKAKKIYHQIRSNDKLGSQNQVMIILYPLQVPRLYAKPSKLKTALLQHSTVLKEKYYPPFWCIWGTMHTIMRQMFRTCPRLPFERYVISNVSWSGSKQHDPFLETYSNFRTVVKSAWIG